MQVTIGFQPILARPYKPNTKGKVENSVNYVKQNFFAGEEFRSLKEVNQRAREWLAKINQRIHATTHEKPFDRLLQEQLITLAPSPYDITEIVYRKVSLESYVHFRSALGKVALILQVKVLSCQLLVSVT